MITAENKIILNRIANRLFEENVGGSFWCEDRNDLEYGETKEYFINNKETYKVTTQEEIDFILSQLYELCDTCACCGWIWWRDQMDYCDGDLLCNDCITDRGGRDEEE